MALVHAVARGIIFRSSDGGLTAVTRGAPGRDQPVEFLSR